LKKRREAYHDRKKRKTTKANKGVSRKRPTETDRHPEAYDPREEKRKDEAPANKKKRQNRVEDRIEFASLDQKKRVI